MVVLHLYNIELIIVPMPEVTGMMLRMKHTQAIKQLEGEESHLEEYADPKSEKYRNMVEQIAKNLGIDSLMYQDLDDLVEAIGLPKEKLCTHCWDGSSYF